MIDFYAIKAGECKWFIDLYNYWEKNKNLSQLPNFAYSIALAHHILSTTTKKTESNKSAGDKNSANESEKPLSTSTLSLSEELSAQADKLIQYAILMFPSVILPLLDKCGVQLDARTKNHAFFNSQAQYR